MARTYKKRNPYKKNRKEDLEYKMRADKRGRNKKIRRMKNWEIKND